MAKAPSKRKLASSSSSAAGIDASSLNDTDLLSALVGGLYDTGMIATHHNFALFSSGLILPDIHNSGFYDPDVDEIYMGFPTGRINYIIGDTGVGKTTLAVQIGAGIIEPYPLGQMFVYDGEKSHRLNRLQQITGIHEKKASRLMLVNKNTNLENFLAMVNSIHDMKVQNADRFNIKVKFGTEEIEVMQPTVVIVDSVASLTKLAFSSEAELGSNMEGAQNAIFSNKMIKNLMDKLIAANIFVYAINHITVKVNTSATPLPRNPIPGLKPEESVSGGSGWRYYADWFVRISRVADKTMDKDGINATLCEIQLLKARTFPTGEKFPMLFNRSNGGVWDDFASQIEFMIKKGTLVLKGSRYTMEGYPTSFYHADIKKKFEAEEPFQEAFLVALQAAIIKHVPSMSSTELSGIVMEEEPEVEFDS